MDIRREIGSYEGNIQYIDLTSLKDYTRIIFLLNDLKFYIDIPLNYKPNNTDVITVEECNDMMINVNLYSYRKRPTLHKLLTYIEKKYNKIEHTTRQKESTETDDFELQLNILKEKLNKSIPKMHGKLTSETEQGRRELQIEHLSKINEERTSSGSILVNEYISILKNLKDNNNIKIKLEDENIYNWIVELHNLKSNSCKIVVNIYLHDKLYPNYPPQLVILSPILISSFYKKIKNLKMVKLEYWTPTRGMNYIINKLWQIFNINNCIDETKQLTVSNESKLNLLLQQLQNCDNMDDVDELDNTIYHCIKKETTLFVKTSKKVRWKAGTGYGHVGISEWDINEYVKSKHEQELQMKNILKQIYKLLKELDEDERVNLITQTDLIKYLKNRLNGLNLLEFGKSRDLYGFVVKIVSFLATDKMTNFFSSTGYDIYKSVICILKQAEISSKLNTDKTDVISKFIIGNISSYNSLRIVEVREVTKEINLYFKQLSSIKANFGIIKNFTYKSELGRKNQTRISKEITSLMNDLPIHYNSSIFAVFDEEDIGKIRFAISGSDKTPYDSGLFIFDVYIPITYPVVPPKVNLFNNGNVRFNPNLYNDGKVCLSLLGTWSGDKGESWNANTSTLLQVLISIQAQILIETPVFNEPGYETYIGKPIGDDMNMSYNQNIRLYTMRHAMNDLLENIDTTYECFKDVIINHFIQKKDYIKTIVNEWCKDSTNKTTNVRVPNKTTNQMYDGAKTKLFKLLDNLQ